MRCFMCQKFTWTLLENEDLIRIVFVYSVSTVLPGKWQYSHTNKSNTATAKEGVKQTFSHRIYNVICLLIF